MERVAIIAIIVENTDSIYKLNSILHDYRKYIIGRMGIPYSKKNINIISVAVDAKPDIINSMGGQIGRLEGITSKILYSAKPDE